MNNEFYLEIAQGRDGDRGEQGPIGAIDQSDPGISNALVPLGQYNVEPVSGVNGSYNPLQSTENLLLKVSMASYAASASVANALSRVRVMSAASTNATSVKASAGNIYDWLITNNSSSDRFLKLYDKASAPTVGTDAPVATLLIPQKSALVKPLWPIAFTSGIAFAITGAVGDGDTTNISANDISGFIAYK